jgi:hypothetical protein
MKQGRKGQEYVRLEGQCKDLKWVRLEEEGPAIGWAGGLSCKLAACNIMILSLTMKVCESTMMESSSQKPNKYFFHDDATSGRDHPQDRPGGQDFAMNGEY